MPDIPPLHEVRLREVPLRLRALSTEHVDGLLHVHRDALDLAAGTRRGGRPRDGLPLPPEAAAFARRVIEVLDEVDAFCRGGRYQLTLAAPEDIAAYRRWSLNEVALQIDGAPPMSWPQYAEAHGIEA
jgi:hypothetical protein